MFCPKRIRAGWRIVRFFFATEILRNAVGDLDRQSGLAAWLKQRQVIKAVALIINHDVAVNVLVGREPFEHFFAARYLGAIRTDVSKGYAVEPRGQQPDRIG